MLIRLRFHFIEVKEIYEQHSLSWGSFSSHLLNAFCTYITTPENDCQLLICPMCDQLTKRVFLGEISIFAGKKMQCSNSCRQFKSILTVVLLEGETNPEDPCTANAPFHCIAIVTAQHWIHPCIQYSKQRKSDCRAFRPPLQPTLLDLHFIHWQKKEMGILWIRRGDKKGGNVFHNTWILDLYYPTKESSLELLTSA